MGAGLVKDTKLTTIDGKVVSILADTGAKLDRDGDGAILEVRSANTDVRIYDLQITGQTGTSDAAVSLVSSGGVPKLTLTRVKVDGNQGAGVSSAGGALTISQSTVAANQGGGIVMSAPGAVNISNSFIYRNGNTISTSAGGVLLSPMGASKFEFNTVTDNQASTSVLSAGGIVCNATGFVAANNIIFRNTGGPANAQTLGDCTFGNSFVMSASAVDNTPQFANPNSAPFDYHLTAQSPTTIRNAAGACTGTDFDGNTRPKDGACDLGADEL
ncbi:MAG TPA: right-handed parallel beta-helix repeat-containing protein [Kofleriaceae bacterium]|nr:right-handed parallel beta-helix repeat-containing protein [Kofleriaceae bacterium]